VIEDVVFNTDEYVAARKAMQHEPDDEDCLDRHVDVVDQDLFLDVMVLGSLGELVESLEDAVDPE
jgi:hypothetical protein